MKKIYSLVKASMTSDMSFLKIKVKNKKYGSIIPIAISLYLMFAIGLLAYSIFKKQAEFQVQHVILALFVFGISIATFFEGIYKSGPLIFNCKDDQLLLSLPLKRRTVLFLRIFKFYTFELIFNSVFLLPIMVAFALCSDNITWTYYLSSIIMLLFLPIIPIVISCIFGVLISSLSSRFKFKNAAQIIITMAYILGLFYINYNIDSFFEYVAKHANSLNELLIKIYYPAGIYAKLVTDFHASDLIIFILINIVIFIVTIFILSKVYFKINSRLKKVTSSKKVRIDNLVIKSQNRTISLIKKELNTFFKTPVFIINAGFSLLLFIIVVILIMVKFDTVIPILTNPEMGFGITKDFIMNNLSIMILFLLIITSFLTSITSSVISLEGRNINILKSLPISSKSILLSKVYSSLVLTTPILVIGTMMLLFKFKINIIESLLLIFLTVAIPLVSHFLGIIINLKYPKLDAENSVEVVKQSTSSFISVMLGMILLIASIAVIYRFVDKLSSTLILFITTIIFIIIDLILYLYLTKIGVKDYKKINI